jgi:holo-[acyl-carrier protein] synthase
MIRGIGTDVVDIERFARIVRGSRDGFREHLFTEREIAYCERYRKSEASYAAVFAAKEAFLKALRTGLAPGMRWTDTEVLHERSGAPSIVAHGRCAELLGDGRVHVTLSHSELSATAVVIIEDVDPDTETEHP